MYFHTRFWGRLGKSGWTSKTNWYNFSGDFITSGSFTEEMLMKSPAILYHIHEKIDLIQPLGSGAAGLQVVSVQVEIKKIRVRGQLMKQNMHLFS